MLIDSLHVSFDSFNFESILPMLVLVCGGIFTLLINAFTSRFSRNLNVFFMHALFGFGFFGGFRVRKSKKTPFLGF